MTERSTCSWLETDMSAFVQLKGVHPEGTCVLWDEMQGCMQGVYVGHCAICNSGQEYSTVW